MFMYQRSFLETTPTYEYGIVPPPPLRPPKENVIVFNTPRSYEWLFMIMQPTQMAMGSGLWKFGQKKLTPLFLLPFRHW